MEQDLTNSTIAQSMTAAESSELEKMLSAGEARLAEREKARTPEASTDQQTSAPPAAPVQPAGDTPDSSTDDTSSATPAKPAGAEQHTTQQTQPTEGKPGDKPPEGAEGSKYARERARFEVNWKKFNEEKETTRRAFEDREKAAALREAELQQWERELDRRHPITTKADYAKQVESYKAQVAAAEKAGNYDQADKLRAYQELLEQAMAAAPETAEIPQRKQWLETARAKSWAVAARELPGVADEKSPLYRAVVDFFMENPEAYAFPNAPLLVSRYCNALLGSTRAAELEQTVKALTGEKETLSKRVKELEEQTSIPAGGQFTQGGTRKFEDLSMDEQRAALKAELAATT